MTNYKPTSESLSGEWISNVTKSEWTFDDDSKKCLNSISNLSLLLSVTFTVFAIVSISKTPFFFPLNLAYSF